MDLEPHAVAGGILAAFDAVYDAISNNKPINILEVLSSALIGAGSAILPDILEPASSPNHRSLFHSVAFSSLPITYLKQSQNPSEIRDPYRKIKRSFAIGYLSHLVLDGTTTKGLPLLI